MKDLSTRLPDPVRTESRTGVDAAMKSLGETITAIPRETTSIQHARSRRARRALTLAAATAACLLAALIGVTQLIDGGGAQPEWAAADIAVAEQSPLLLLKASGWNVSRFDQYTAKNKSGSMQFESSAGGEPISLHWEPRGHINSTRRRLANRTTRLPMITIDGHQAELYRGHADGEPVWTGHSAMWVAGKYLLTLSDSYKGRPSTLADDRFTKTASQLKSVSTGEFLSNLPKDYLLPSKIPAAAEEILADVPLPEAYTSERVLTNLQSTSRTALAQRLITHVQCGWIGNWVAARKRGDRAEMDRIWKSVADYRTWKYVRTRLPDEKVVITLGAGFMDSLNRGGQVRFDRFYKPQDIGKIYKRDMGCDF